MGFRAEQDARRATRGARKPPPADAGNHGAIEGIAERDVAAFAWSLAREIAEERLQGPRASLLSGLARILFAIGAGNMSREDALREAELRGLLMHGQSPREPGEWELAGAVFHPAVLERARSWLNGLDAPSEPLHSESGPRETS